jgi:hypothetical protein
MKKIILLFLISITTLAYSQTKAELAGVWFSKVDAGEKPTTPSYFVLNSDGTYTWGVDSTGADVLGNSTVGTWDLTLDKEIKIISTDKKDIKYYAPTGADKKYKYKYFEKEGQKTLDKTTDMSIIIQKISN